MALTRPKVKEILSKAGADEDKITVAIDEIIAGHTSTVDALKEERDNYKADAEKLPQVTKERDDYKKQAEANDGENPFEKKYNDEHSAFEDFKKKVATEDLKRAKSKAYKSLYKEANIADKYWDALLRIADYDKLKLDKDGNIEDKDALIEAIKKENAEFVVETQERGADTKNPPPGGQEQDDTTAASNRAANYYAAKYGKKEDK